jgi:cytochrome c-type biogenesis protein CcmH/NrfG
VARVLIRALIVVLALLAGGWLAVQERAAHAESEIDEIAFGPGDTLGSGTVARAEELLRTDRRLNPDRRPDLYEAVVLGRAGRTREAISVLRRTVAAEPENLEAWALLARAARSEDPALAARARARQRELAPPVPDS